MRFDATSPVDHQLRFRSFGFDIGLAPSDPLRPLVVQPNGLDDAEHPTVEPGTWLPLGDARERPLAGGLDQIVRLVCGPSKARALLAAMLEWSVDEMDVRANKVVAMADGLFRLLDWQAQTIAHRAQLIDYWRIMDRRAPEILAARRRMRNIYRPLLRKAIEEGLCRPDIRVEDILLVSVMLAAALRAGPDAGAAQTARQMLGLIVKGLR